MTLDRLRVFSQAEDRFGSSIKVGGEEGGGREETQDSYWLNKIETTLSLTSQGPTTHEESPAALLVAQGRGCGMTETKERRMMGPFGTIQ
ncbi:hypothetical protein BPAE_0057g00160 [Botrytis paeoniae]|uniref:Uncharacterized protein n=1 Tax=Botrytis paeoniae TaxID=278948 RepID=A0A4Z1FT96_9HELO|nr:hypothetical protein BPAE_0057g00160 [Botrytis paeoniae]